MQKEAFNESYPIYRKGNFHHRLCTSHEEAVLCGEIWSRPGKETIPFIIKMTPNIEPSYVHDLSVFEKEII